MSERWITRRAARTHGLTLVELVIVLALLAVVATLAAPSFSAFLAKRRVEGIFAELITDLQYARSEAVQRNEDVHVIIGPSCYFIHTATASGGACTATTITPPGTGVTLKRVHLNDSPTIAIAPTPSLISFEAVRGAATAPGTVNVNNSVGNLQLRTVVTAVGRVHTCSPNASVSGYGTCSP